MPTRKSPIRKELEKIVKMVKAEKGTGENPKIDLALRRLVKETERRMQTAISEKLEAAILSAVEKEGAAAYAGRIRHRVLADTGRKVTVRAVTAILVRLEKQGSVRSWMGEGEDGRHQRKYFALADPK